MANHFDKITKTRTMISVNALLKFFSKEFIRERMGYDFQLKDSKGLIDYDRSFEVVLIKKNHQVIDMEKSM